MIKTIQVYVEGEAYGFKFFECDACGRRIVTTKEPLITEQVCLTITHPGGATEVVHESNVENGRANFFCLDCALKSTGIQSVSDKERVNVAGAVVRNTSYKSDIVNKAVDFGATLSGDEVQKNV